MGRLIRRLRISDPPVPLPVDRDDRAPDVAEHAGGGLGTALYERANRDQWLRGRRAGIRVSIATCRRPPVRIDLDLGDGEPSPSSHLRDSVRAGMPRWPRARSAGSWRSTRSTTAKSRTRTSSGCSTSVADRDPASNAKIYADLKELLLGSSVRLRRRSTPRTRIRRGIRNGARIAVRLAEEIGPAPKRSDLYLAGLLHDIGKIGIDDGVLKKNGPADARGVQEDPGPRRDRRDDPQGPAEAASHFPGRAASSREHGRQRISRPTLRAKTSRWRLRILAVADSFDAMSSNRPIAAARASRRSTTSSVKGRGVQWDPHVIDALFACRGDVELIRQKGLGESLFGAVEVTLGRR